MEKVLVNRIAQSGILTIDLEKFYPTNEIITIDLKDFLFQGMILREKDFRQKLKEIDWSQYQDKIVLIECSADAIVPLWAYMLITVYLRPFAHDIYQGEIEDYLNYYYLNYFSSFGIESYNDKRVVIKGCSKKNIPAGVYLSISKLLIPRAKSIMYGEPCSTVPIYKAPRKKE